jgi:6-phosphofructokinase 1
MKKLAVLTSGGDSPGLNAALRAIAKMAAARGIQVFAALEGYDGLIDGKFRELTRRVNGDSLGVELEVEISGGLGGTFIGTARSMRFMQPEGRAQAATHLRAQGFEGLIVMGGNGSLTGAHLLAKEQDIRLIGVPGSIDNDIGCTSTSLGVDTALNTIVDALDHISDTARAHRRAFVVEVMGRDCGYLALASAVAVGADGVLIREQGKTEEELVDAVSGVIRHGVARGKRRILVIKGEGVQVPCTRLVRLTQERLGTELPGLEIRATVLGHVVRGGAPSYQDRAVAGRLGFVAVKALIDGRTDEMVAWQPHVAGGAATEDAAVQLFSLERVLDETRALIDGTSPVTKRRLALMQRASEVLAL